MASTQHVGVQTSPSPPSFRQQAAALRPAPHFNPREREPERAPDHVPFGVLWHRHATLRATYGWQIRRISGEEAMIRSGLMSIIAPAGAITFANGMVKLRQWRAR